VVVLICYYELYLVLILEENNCDLVYFLGDINWILH
jgi:hypothetical protein